MRAITAQGYGSDDKLSRAGDSATGTIVFDGTPPIKVPAGAASGDVLTSDASGNATWAPPASTTAPVDTTASDIQPLGSRAAGSTGKPADAAHVHAMPTVDQLGAPAANVPWNSKKITGLANGSASTDAAAFGQIPVLDSTSSDIQALGTQAAGSTGKPADAGHVHPASLATDLDITAAGHGLRVAEGSNAKQGTITMTGTTGVLVANTSVTANSRIFLTIQVPPTGGSAPGVPYVFSRSAGASFTVKSTVATTDNSVVAYLITEPG